MALAEILACNARGAAMFSVAVLVTSIWGADQ